MGSILTVLFGLGRMLLFGLLLLSQIDHLLLNTTVGAVEWLEICEMENIELEKDIEVEEEVVFSSSHLGPSFRDSSMNHILSPSSVLPYLCYKREVISPPPEAQPIDPTG